MYTRRRQNIQRALYAEKVIMNSKLFILLIVFFVGLITGYAQAPNDCQFSVVVCGNSDINIDVSGVGNQELTGSNTCGSQENNSIWLQVAIETPGTLGFILTPESSAITEDYDFFVFGPNVTCGNIGQAIRCSTTNPQAANQGNNLTGMNGTETDTSEGPGPNGNSFVSWLNVQAGESYFIVIDRPIGTSAFSLEWIGTASFPEPPTNENNSFVNNNSQCDNLPPFDDGIAEFNLNDLSDLMIGNQLNTTISFHISESDANIGTNPLNSNYTNSTVGQNIYARILNSVTGCFIVETVALQISPGPDINTPSDFNVCDISDGNSDGQTTFDLLVKTQEITFGFDPDNYLITYHININDANNGVSPLPQLFTNTVATPLQIFARVEDALNPGCVRITSFNLNAFIPPELNNTTIIQCDEDGIPEGFTQFNLLNHLDEISPNPADHTFSFHLTFQDAQLEENEIDASNFGNFFNPQTLFAKVTNIDTGCDNIAEITLEIAVTQIQDLELTNCDEDGSEDGFAQFDLTLVETELPAGLDILYYETYEDALLENSPLSTDYTNITPYSQTVYVRAENANACFGISELELIVFELPNVELEAETFYCLNTFPDTITLFGGIIGDDPSNYYYNWSTGDDESEIQVNAPGTYTVVVSNTDGCSKTRTVTVLPSSTAAIENVEVTDASPNNSITIIVSGDGDYEYALDNSTGPYQDSNTFEGVSIGFHDIYIRDKNGCGITTDLISVIGFPKFFTPNGDAFNPVWRVKGLSTQFQPNSLIHVYDRHGKLLAQLDPVGAGWDGTFNGRPMPSNDYWFSCTLEDGRTFKGHFTLKR